MSTTKTPWHIWVVGFVTLLWHAGGAMDYVMSKTRNAAYLAQMSPEQIAFLDSFPAWLTPFWAIAVWGAVLGSLLILFRSRHAFTTFVVAFVAMILVTIHNVFLAEVNALSTMTAFQAIFTLAIIFVAILMIVYTRTQTNLGRLR